MTNQPIESYADLPAELAERLSDFLAEIDLLLDEGEGHYLTYDIHALGVPLEKANAIIEDAIRDHFDPS